MRKIKLLSEEQKRIEELESQLRTANDRYRSLDITTVDIEVLRNAKMEQLDEACNLAIINGFEYTINNVSYHFSCSLSAQANFQGTDTLFKDGVIAETEWTVINNEAGKVERIILDQTTFNAIKLEVFSHINTNVTKLRNTLQPQVEQATTNQEIDAVVW